MPFPAASGGKKGHHLNSPKVMPFPAASGGKL